MQFDPDRLQVLAGVRTHTSYRYKKLNEMETKIVLTPETEEEQAMITQLAADVPADEVEVETLAGHAAGVPAVDEPEAPELEGPPEDIDAAPEAETDVPPDVEVEPALDEPIEEKLRRIIRSEVQSIISEEMAKRDDAQIAKAQKTKSVSDAMGFSSFGGGTATQNKPSRRGPTAGVLPGFGFK